MSPSSDLARDGSKQATPFSATCWQFIAALENRNTFACFTTGLKQKFCRPMLQGGRIILWKHRFILPAAGGQ
jgi:hypothetical protein